ncbi:coiled-coil domain-containing protein 112-like [Diabrotica virgifera virgifera]|uniref:Coiled-coil domain-containing protein 112-like n=1 Tax=Diabrotica virgifera virgifera TaxID=50390 RepID=A0A6P7FTY9_DIAVI|nr:coiled-coil domain-containing protein 112-like [Diabrotica virgifera virgifera]
MPVICITELNKLVCFQQCLEKSISATVDHLKKFPTYQYVPDMYVEQEQDRRREKESIRSNIDEIVGNLQSKIKFLKCYSSVNNTDLKKFKHEMIMIQDLIQTLVRNSKMKLKDLDIEYIDINQDLDYYKEKMFEWSEPINIKEPSSIKTDCKRPYSNLKCVEIREFIDFVKRSGGHENGWDKDDHELFIKFRNKFKDVSIVSQKINEILPDKSIQDVQEHEMWYKKYMVLKRNKKEALRRWQETKTKPKLSTVGKLLNDVKKPVLVNKSENYREKLVQWKFEKEEKLRKHLSMEEIEQQKRREMADMRKRRNEEMKRVVEEWKTAKNLLDQECTKRKKEQEENERKRKAAEANKLIKQYQIQDDYYILKMRQHKKRLETLQPVRSKSSQIAKRDPDRLLKPTEQWRNRVQDDTRYPFEEVIPLKKLPKLKVPDWRKKIDQ